MCLIFHSAYSFYNITLVKLITTSEEQTIRLGEDIGKNLQGGEVLCLKGDLGAGKTTLVKGIAKGMGILEGYQVRSPTFTIVNEYPTQKGALIHIDLYRVKDVQVEEFLGKGVVVIEWAENFPFCTCTINILVEDEKRVFVFEGCKELLEFLKVGSSVELF